MDDERPIVGITIGDPAGIGPEVVAAALAREPLRDICRPLLIGDARVLSRAAATVGVALPLRPIGRPPEAHYDGAKFDLVDLENADPSVIPTGHIHEAAGRAAAEYVYRAIDLALAGEIDAIATAPINKASLRAAGISHLDHTAMLADRAGGRDAMTMFVLGDLRIFFATRHTSLRRAIDSLTTELVGSSLVRADAALRAFGIERPRIVVAALNPHAGEGGMFGDEEERILRPAIEEARRRGIEARGPEPADSVFHLVRTRATADAILSLYHDQGHIAAKSMDFERTIAVTTGLPFVRASVDHGTAFDIAGTGLASHVSMAECIRVAAQYAKLFARGRMSLQRAHEDEG